MYINESDLIQFISTERSFAVIKKAKIKIESTIENLNSAGLPEGDGEKTVTEADGTYRYNNGEAVVMYKENSEGGEISTRISLVSDTVSVKREGAIESLLFFKEGERNLSLYSIPPYKFDAEVYAKRVRVNLTADGGSIDLLYNMKIGGAEKSARMKIWIS